MWTGSWNADNTVYTGSFADGSGMTWTGTVTLAVPAGHYIWDGSWA